MNKPYFKSALGLLLGFSIGVVCRFTNIPVPAPPMIYGAFLVLTITIGYMAVDYIISQQNARKNSKAFGISESPDKGVESK